MEGMEKQYIRSKIPNNSKMNWESSENTTEIQMWE